MGIIVVGGHARGVGKTAVVCAVIRAFAERHWTAVKLTAHPHRSEAVFEETDPDGTTDTARFLAAGAARALLLRTGEGEDDTDGRGLVGQLAEGGGSVIVESNRVLRLIRPDLFLFVLRPGCPDWKPSAQAVIGRADAIVLTGPGPFDSTRAPVFLMHELERLPVELVRFIRSTGLVGPPVAGAW